jgi:hypothetical protein
MFRAWAHLQQKCAHYTHLCRYADEKQRKAKEQIKKIDIIKHDQKICKK